MAQLIDGKGIAAEIRQEVAAGVAAIERLGETVDLVSVMVGKSHAGEIYSRSQAGRCNEVGIRYELRALSGSAAVDEVHQAIAQLNADPRVNGIMLNLPVPPAMDAAEIQYRIDPYKDVEGVNPANIGFVFYGRPIVAPCTALAVLEILKSLRQDLKGKHVVVVGQGAVVGRPVTLFLLQEEATVTACHAATRGLHHHTARADVLVVAVGRPGFVTGDMVKPGAVVIDVGINRVPGKQGYTVVGDVDFTTVDGVAEALTPVPGGVGPVTVAILLRNTLEAAKTQLTRRGQSTGRD